MSYIYLATQPNSSCFWQGLVHSRRTTHDISIDRAFLFDEQDSAISQDSPLRLDTFKNLIKTLRESRIPYPEVIVLNCCYTETMAKELADIRTTSSPNNGPFVIGTKLAKVKDNRAVEFTKTFYPSLARGSSLREAFDLARGALDVAGMYFLHTGGRGTDDFQVASSYYVPPTDYMVIPIATRFRRQRESYETLVNRARHPLTCATFVFRGGNTNTLITAAGIEFELAKLPKVASGEITGFYGEADKFLEQDPRPNVPGSNNYARYFVNHRRAITGERRGPCLFAWYRNMVYHEDKGAWVRYRSASNFLLINTGIDPIRWSEELPFEH